MRPVARQVPVVGPAVSLFPQIVLQRQRVVVLFVPRAVEQCDVAAPGRLAERIARLAAVGQLGEIAAAELGPLGRIVPEPASQLVARRDLLEPRVQAKVRLLDAARSEPLHQKAGAVVALGRIIDSFDADHGDTPNI